MRVKSSLVFWRLLAVVLMIPPGAGVRVFAAPPAGYYQVWGDEFNAASLDTTKWDFWLLGSRRDAVNVTSAVSLNGSNLVITTYTSNSVNYTAMIATDTTFCSRFGYWETSIEWGDTNGMWSAMWLQSPTMGTYLYDPFVSGSEIDVAEHRSTDGGSNGDIINVVQPNVHWNGYGSAAQSSGGNNYGSGLGSGFHTYGFMWTSANYTIYIDGTNVRNWNYSQNGVPVSLSTEWFILSSEVQNNLWSGAIPTGGYGSLANSTTKLTVDYARYYAPTNDIFWTGSHSTDLTSSNNYVTNMPPLATSDALFSQLSGNNLSPTLSSALSLDGLIFTHLNNGLALGGAGTLTLGAGGIDMISCNHSVTLNCPINIGLAQTWSIGPNSPGNTLTVNGNVSGSAKLSKGSYGTVILAGANGFTGTLSAGTGSTTANDGFLRLASSGAAANAAAIDIPNNNSGSSTLQLTGGIIVPPPISLNGRNTNVVAIENISGSNTLSGGLTVNVGGSYYLFQSDAGTLNLGGTISSVATGTRTLTFMGAGNFLVSGTLANGSATVNVNQNGSGTLTLAGANTYSGTTTVNGGTLLVNGSIGSGSVIVSNGTLGGTGVISGPVIVQSGATLAPGGGIGFLTVSNNVTLQPGGNTSLALNQALGTNGQLRVTGTLNYGGTLSVTNLAGSLHGGETFQLFSAAASSGNFTALAGSPGAGLTWAFNPASGVLAVYSTVATNLSAAVTSNWLQLSWPADHLGWTLQAQTNGWAAGLGTNWISLPASGTNTQFVAPIDLGVGSVFYRLSLP